jgi:hypothetical protein
MEQIRASVESIGPEQAKRYLATSRGNRPKTQTRVAQYRDDMRAGRWVLSPQGIAFDIEGHLIDGHHRLDAVIAAGVSVQFLVITHAPTDARGVIDTGARRMPRDLANLAYPDRRQLSGNEASWLVGLVALLRPGGATGHLSARQIRDAEETYAAELIWASEVFARQSPKLTRVPIVCAFMYAWIMDPAKVDHMARQYMTGGVTARNDHFLRALSLVVAHIDGRARARTGAGYTALARAATAHHDDAVVEWAQIKASEPTPALKLVGA